MRISKKEFDFNYLKSQVTLKEADLYSIHFRNGFNEFVRSFFLDLQSCSAPFAHKDGSHDIDLQVVLELSLETMDFFSSQLPVETRKDYWSGVMKAVTLSESTVRFAFEIQPENLAA